MKTLKTNEILNWYSLIKDVSIGQVESARDRRSLLNTAVAMKGVCDQFESLQKMAVDKHKGVKHDELIGKYQQWQDEERDGKEITLTVEERNEVAKYVSDLTRSINECLDDDVKKEHTLDLRAISEESFDQFIVGQPWSIELIMKLQDLLTK